MSHPNPARLRAVRGQIATLLNADRECLPLRADIIAQVYRDARKPYETMAAWVYRNARLRIDQDYDPRYVYLLSQRATASRILKRESNGKPPTPAENRWVGNDCSLARKRAANYARDAAARTGGRLAVKP
jgi:hypothetical protein